MKNGNSESSAPPINEISASFPIAAADDTINVLDLILVLVKNKKIIIRVSAIAFVLTCGIALLLPNVYTANTRILPPKDDKNGLPLTAGLGGLVSLPGLNIGSSSGDLYVGMLKSRTIADAIIDRFKLMEVYDKDFRVETYKELGKKVEISIGSDDGIISIAVEDNDAPRTAAMANAYVEELKRLNLKLNVGSAGRERRFLEKRLEIVKGDLAATEENLKDFQRINKAIKIDDQATAIIEAIGKLKGELAAKEVQLGTLLSFQTNQNPQVKALREEIDQFKKQIDKREQAPSGLNTPNDIFIATSDVPELGVQYARLLREYKVQETLYEMLTKQYEIAKIEEAKNTSKIQVLDEAVAPDKKSKPKRALIVIIATAIAGFLAVFYSFVREYARQMPEEDRQRMKEIKNALKLNKGVEEERG